MLAISQALIPDPKLLLIDELSLGLAPTIVGQLDRRRAPDPRDRRSRSWSSSSRSTSPCGSPSGPCSWRRASSASPARPRSCSTGPTSCARCSSPAPRPGARGTGRRRSAASGGAEGGRGRRRCAGASPRCRRRRTPPVRARVPGGREAVRRHHRRRRRRPRSCAQGQILGLIGQNGAGKTTLFDCVSGFLRVDGGRIIVQGRGHHRAARPTSGRALGLGRSFQEARLFPTLTTTETIAVARERHLLNRSMVAAALGQPVARDSEDDVADEGRRPHRPHGPRRVPREAHRRAVDRHPAHRRAGLPARLRPRR